jgi:hypothetical protein
MTVKEELFGNIEGVNVLNSNSIFLNLLKFRAPEG